MPPCPRAQSHDSGGGGPGAALEGAVLWPNRQIANGPAGIKKLVKKLSPEDEVVN